MTSARFDYAPLLPAGLPAAAARWTGLAKYSFVGGNNDAEQVPVADLKAAAEAVLTREGHTLATYGLASGPQGYLPMRNFIADKLKRDAGMTCTVDDILMVSGSLQALDLVNHALLAKGDTVIIEQDCYQGSINRLTRLGVNIVGIPLDQDGMRMDALAAALADLQAKGVRPKYIYTIPTVQNPTATIMPESRRRELLALSGNMACRCSRTTAMRTSSGPASARQRSKRWIRPAASFTSARSRSRSPLPCASASSWHHGRSCRACWR